MTATATPAERTAAPRRFRPDIEGMRAIAIVLVVLYHANVHAFSGGYVGVDVFFVISGFLITRQLLGEVDRTGKLSIAGFYARRMRRLLPASTVVLIATLIAAREWLPVLQLKSLTRDVFFTVVYGMNYHLAAAKTNYLNADTPPSPLQHFWSLSVEEQFYFVWPLLIVLVTMLARRRRRAAFLGVLVAITAVSLTLSIVTTTPKNSVAYFGLHTRAWELALGAIVAMTITQWQRLPAAVGAALAWLGLVMIGIAAVRFSDATPFPGSAAVLPVAGAVLVIGAGCALLPFGPERLLALSPMQLVGKLSYSWYLWHWPAILLAPAMMHRRSLPIWGNLLAALVALALAGLTFVLVERPTRRLSIPRPAWIGVGVGLSAAAAAVSLAVAVTIPSLRGHGVAVALPLPSPSASGSASADDAITAALRQGLQTVAVPSNLTPALDKARVDSPAATFDGCHEDYLATSQGACVYGDPNGTKTVVLFGDSHMEQWLPAFDAAGKSLHWKVVNWTKATCPLADVVTKSAFLGRDYPECTSWKAATIARIAALHPTLVFAGSGDDDDVTKLPDATWTAATVRTLQKLHAAVGAPVIYFDDTPYGLAHAPDCLAAHLDDVRPCDFPVATAYTSLSRHAAEHAAVVAAGIPAVDPIRWLCTPGSDGQCPVVVGNVLVYRDYQHVTATYSRTLAPAFRALLSATWP